MEFQSHITTVIELIVLLPCTALQNGIRQTPDHIKNPVPLISTTPARREVSDSASAWTSPSRSCFHHGTSLRLQVTSRLLGLDLPPDTITQLTRGMHSTLHPPDPTIGALSASSLCNSSCCTFQAPCYWATASRSQLDEGEMKPCSCCTPCQCFQGPSVANSLW